MATTIEVVQQFTKKTVPQLKAYAKKNNIDLFGVKTRNEILEVIFSFVPREVKETIIKPVPPTEKVAIYSLRNLSWVGVGALTEGYNIVTKEAADQWVTNKSVRAATPEEVKRAYGK